MKEEHRAICWIQLGKLFNGKC